MSVKLRMSRIGRRHRPFFRINAIESRAPRDGRIIEKLGHYDPLIRDTEKQLVLNVERVRFWLDNGAIPSDTVSQLMLRKGIKNIHEEKRKARLAKAKAQARAKGKFFNKAEKIAAEKAAEQAKNDAEQKAKEAEEKLKADAKAKEEKEKADAAAAEAAEQAKVEAEAAKQAKVKEEAAPAEEKTETKEETSEVATEEKPAEQEAAAAEDQAKE